MEKLEKLIDKIESDTLAYYSAVEVLEMLKHLSFQLSKDNVE